MATHIITSRTSAGGTILPLGATTVTDGQDQSYTITAASGYALSELYVDDVLTTLAASYTFPANSANHTIASIFALSGGRYSSQSDLIQRIGTGRLAELSNDTALATTPDPLVVAAMIDQADRFIDSHVGMAYTVPFVAPTNCDSIPTAIKQLSIELAVYYCMTRRFTVMEMPKDWKEIYKEACERLEAIANLTIALDGDPTVLNSQSSITSPTQRAAFEDTDSQWSEF